MEQDGVSLPVIEAHAEYRRAARYDDELEIRTRATLLTPVRIRFDYEVWRPDEEARWRPAIPSMPPWTRPAAPAASGRRARAGRRTGVMTGPPQASGTARSSMRQ